MLKRANSKAFVLMTILTALLVLSMGCSSTANGDERGGSKDKAAAAEGPDAAAVVVIDGNVVSRAQYEDALYERFAEDFLETYIETRLIEAKAAKMGVKADEAKIKEEVERNVSTLLKTRFGNNEAQMRQALQDRGMSLEGWRKELADKARREQLIDAMVKQTRDGGSDTVRKRFEQKYGEDGVKYRVRHILVSTKVINSKFYTKEEYATEKGQIEDELKALGGEIMARLKKGDAFDKLAKQYSDDYTSNRGGDLGEAWKGRFGKLFDEAVGKLEVGQTSALVRAKRGYHLIEVTRVNPGVEYRGAAILVSNGPSGPSDDRTAEQREKDALAKVEKVKAELAGGKAFADVAKAMSDDMATSARGGDLGVFGRRRLGTEVDGVLDKAKAGSVTDPVKTPRGYWIVKLDSKKSVPSKDRRVVRHIFLSAEFDDIKKRRLEGKLDGMAKKKAEELKARVEKGDDFKDLAIEFTEDAYTRKAGGEYYNFRRTSLGPEVWTAVGEMSPGKETRLIKSKRGYHVLQVIEKTETKFDDVKGELLKEMNEQPISPADKRAFLDKIKAEAKIERKIGSEPVKAADKVPAKKSQPAKKGEGKDKAPVKP